ncbi:DUF2252 domain-containing protein [Conexibacter woesei]|uniref:DUF2252 domain-containing protein n=1 Tax=Conexibacter woesei (strain DSM 14684 / CCUG 47730 / CIP 108061 / JCM 11494 / NBRC 100937 / ID131577) TaxID=469383 RepID=D3EZV5_CONWI|nr:DUF2252 domain-containing protein [Conexibacter woesei]ADB49931.1 Protein of unknown function DUF2252 [Conexibacter woesei DSM 14684]
MSTAERVTSRDERIARGRAARAEIRRRDHGEWEPAADRADPIELLERQGRDRIAELLPLRYERMSASPFTFFRGSAAVMAADLARTPVSGERVQLCGDAHLANFGGFGAPDRTIVFDLNDFDETLPGPWEWDVKRLAASIVLAARDRGFDSDEQAAAVHAAVGAYRRAIRDFAGQSHLDVWYARLNADSVIEEWRSRVPRAQMRTFERNVEKARSKTSMKAVARLTERVDGELRIAADPPLIVPIEDELPEGAGTGPEIEQLVRGILSGYAASLTGATRRLLERYHYVHAARKVVGVGSVGTRAWIALLIGDDERDPLFLQLKEANASVVEPFAGASRFNRHGRRVVEGQWLMQAASDICLGWVSVDDPDGNRRDFYVRQLWDWKRSADLERIVPAGLSAYGQMCGWTLARAHARSGDALAIGAYLGGGDAFERAIARFAATYSDQTERDHAALVAHLAAPVRQ